MIDLGFKNIMLLFICLLGLCKAQENSNSDEDMMEFGEWLLHDENRPPFTNESKRQLVQLWKEQKPKILYYE